MSGALENTGRILIYQNEKGDTKIDVYFEEQNMHSLSSDGELMLTLLASFAEEEAKSMSNNIRWKVQKTFEEGKVFGIHDFYGYKVVDGNYVIQEAFASTNYESEFSSYPLEEDLYRLFVNSYLFSNSKGTIAIQDAILHNDLKKMIHLFEGKSKELYDVMNTMEFLSFKQNDDLNRYYKKLHGKNIDATDRANIRREMYGDFSSSLLKNYTIHLLNYVKNKDIPLDDILFFYKWYLGQLESFYQSYYVTYQDNIDIHSSDYLIYLEKITKQLFQTLAEEYQVAESDIYKRFSSLSS